MSRQSPDDFLQDLPTLPGLEGIFDPNDLKGSLEGMPDYKQDTEVLSMAELKNIEKRFNLSKMSGPEDQDHSGEGTISEDKRIQAALSLGPPKHNDVIMHTPKKSEHADLFEFAGYDGTDIRSNPETPLQADFTFDEGSPALKRVHSEQGTTMSPRSQVNQSTARLTEDRGHGLNFSLLNTSTSRRGLLESSYQSIPTRYAPLSTNRNQRPLSRLRENTPVGYESQLSDANRYAGQQQTHDVNQHWNYNRNINNTIYHHDQPLGYGQHMERSQYPEPSVSDTQHSFSQLPYLGQQIHGNVNRSIFEPLQRHDAQDLPLSQSLVTSHHRSLSLGKQGHGMFKQESPELRTDGLVYSSFIEANQDRGTNTLALNDDSVPHHERDKQFYVNMLKDAMMDMDYAEDNAGMVATWNKMRQDRNKVEQACWALVEVVMRAYNPSHIGPLVAGTKPNNKYESFRKRIDALVEGLRTQKTMCKHIMAPPYVDQLVDDPLNAITRIKNNRKVNHGKKVAIQKGRSALGEKGQGKGRRTVKVAQEEDYEAEDDLGIEHDNLDADYDLEEEEESVPEEPHMRQTAAPRRHSVKRARQTDSEESQDPTYGQRNPTPKKAKKPSRSMYQLNELGQMVDTSIPIQQLPSPSGGCAPLYNTSNRVDLQCNQRRSGQFPNLRQQAHHQNGRQNLALNYPNPYPPTRPVTEHQNVLNDFDNPEYTTTTTDFTSGTEGEYEYNPYPGYGSDMQSGGAGGQARRH